MDIFKLFCAYIARLYNWILGEQFGIEDIFSSVNFVGSQNLDLREVILSPCASVDTDETQQDP